jgi:hypothetical protein
MARLFGLAVLVVAAAAQPHDFPHYSPDYPMNMHGPGCELAVTLRGFGSHKGYDLDGDYYYNGFYVYTKIIQSMKVQVNLLTPDPDQRNETLRTKWSLVFIHWDVAFDGIATCSDCSTVNVSHKGYGISPEWPVAVTSGTSWVLAPTSGRSGTLKPSTNCCKRMPQPSDSCIPKVCNTTSIETCGSDKNAHCEIVDVQDPSTHPDPPTHKECHCQKPEQVCQNSDVTFAQRLPGRDTDGSNAEAENVRAILV